MLCLVKKVWNDRLNYHLTDFKDKAIMIKKGKG